MIATPRTIRAFTVRQPWASEIAYNGKDVENRTRNIAGGYRGPVAIHAASRVDTDLPTSLWPAGQFPRSAILAVANLVDVHFSTACDTHRPVPAFCTPWAQAGAFHLVLANVRTLPHPITEHANGDPIRGFLGLWELPRDIAAMVAEALRELERVA